MARTWNYSVNEDNGVAVSGTKVYIGTTAASPANDTFKQIGRLLSIPTFGPKGTPITLDLVGNGNQVTLHGIDVLGQGDFEFVWDAEDDGQAAVIAAQQDKSNNYNLVVELPDPGSPGGRGTMYDLKVKVLGATRVSGTANNPWKLVMTVGFNSLPAETAATST